METARTVEVEKEGPGWLEVKGADLSGYQITKADTGEKVGSLGHTQPSMKLPAGIYNDQDPPDLIIYAVQEVTHSLFEPLVKGED